MPIESTDPPSAVKNEQNGAVDEALLDVVDDRTDLTFKLATLPARGMIAMHAAIKRDLGVTLSSTGRGRTLAQQWQIFGGDQRRYVPCSEETYNAHTALEQGRTKRFPAADRAKVAALLGIEIPDEEFWTKIRNANRTFPAMAAVPGTSPHGLWCADDLALPGGRNLTEQVVNWLFDNERHFGFAHSTTTEIWHVQWFVGDTVPQAVLEFEVENPFVGNALQTPERLQHQEADRVKTIKVDGKDALFTAPPAEKPSRRLVARVLDGESVVESILPPKRDVSFAVRIAIPEKGDVAADSAAPALPESPGPTVDLEVVVSGDVWPHQPVSQTISISREKLDQPSTWAVFPFTTRDSGSVVSIEILVLYQGKPLQAATYVSPVRSAALPGEKPTLTTFALSGPDEPSDELRPVDVTLDGRGAELVHVHGRDGEVLITGVQAMLDKIEDRVSRVLGVTGAPDSFDDKRAVDLLISLARLGVELKTSLAPLNLAEARSINVIINPDTRVLPLELAYAAPPPDKDAKLCAAHIAHPPPQGQSCNRASKQIVCPYAFWGLHRSIARTVASEQRRQQTSVTQPVSAYSVLYAATVIADAGASDPLPSTRVFETAKTVFSPVTRVTSWTAWRKAVKIQKPNLLVVLGHTMIEGGETNLYIGGKSVLPRVEISAAELRATDSPPPLVLLIACATAALGDPFGTLPGALTAQGAGAVVATLSKIVGPQGATATTHLLQSFHNLAGTGASVGDSVAAARRSLVAAKRPIGLILVSHGEIDTKVVG